TGTTARFAPGAFERGKGPGEIKQELSEKAFGVFAGALDTGVEGIEETRKRVGGVTFISPEIKGKERTTRKELFVPVFKPKVIKPRPTITKEIPLTLLGIPKRLEVEDESRVLGEGDRGISMGVSVPLVDKLSEEAKGFKERRERVTKFGEVFSKLFEPITTKIEDIGSFITLGKGKPIGERGVIGRGVQAGVTTLIGLPIFIARDIPIVTAEALSVVETFIKPETRPIGIKAIKPAAIKTLKEAITPEFIGSVLGASAIGIGLKVTKVPEAARVLKDIAKEPPPKIVGEQIFGFDPIKIDIKTQKILRTEKVEVIKPSDLVTTSIRALQPKPIGAVA
ncbi:hypothetical protein LCGC14_3141930, partial [marine sediment metagenome]